MYHPSLLIISFLIIAYSLKSYENTRFMRENTLFVRETVYTFTSGLNGGGGGKCEIRNERLAIRSGQLALADRLI
jgi:hypothetical protein